jgi:hypothetical protein
MPSTPLNNWLQWLEQSPWSLAIRQSTWLYPALEIVHITGIVLLVGSAFLFDIRILGFSTKIPVSSLERHLLTWSMRALILVIPSGLLLFITNAVALAHNPFFHTKLILIGVAAVNAWVFHTITLQSVSGWDISTPSPALAKLAAAVSIITWIGVIACGRLLAY